MTRNKCKRPRPPRPAQKAKAKSHPSNTIQTSSEIHLRRRARNALPEVSLADLPQLLQTACAKAGWNSLMPVQSRALPYLLEGRDLMVQSRTAAVRREPICFRLWPV